ncbi:hypothetical protein RND81_02G223700 [Saponaria officinalis]|uniref:Uncharacterized protein n=1 Tax=Saponaria officinalis TaxID=3572 RepID=A0AAW1MW30_SAPOF
MENKSYLKATMLLIFAVMLVTSSWGSVAAEGVPTLSTDSYGDPDRPCSSTYDCREWMCLAPQCDNGVCSCPGRPPSAV